MRWASLLLVCVGLRAARAQRVCQRGWLYVKDKCWKYEQAALPFQAARSVCRGQASDLASIHSEEENRFTYSLIQKYGVPGFGRLRDAGRAAADRPTNGQIFFAQVTGPDTSCFRRTAQALLFGYTEVAVPKNNVEDCKKECLNSERIYSFECRSIMYYPETQDCLLNAKRRNDDEETRILFQQNVDGETVNYWDCEGGAPPVRTTPRPIATPVPTDRGCFRFYENSILVGYADEVIEDVTVDECEEECLSAFDNYDFECNSFMYYRRTGAKGPICIINEATKDTVINATLFARDTDADYYEKLRRCPTTVTPAPPTKQCFQRKLDVLFVVDGSGSIGPQSFEDIRRFLNLIVDELQIGFNDTNVGLIQFNESPFTEFSIRGFQTNAEVRNGISSMAWRNGRTMIGRALQHALDRELVRAAGDRPTVPNVVITLTDGLSQDDPSPPAQQMRALNMETYAIGVTDAVFDEQLLAIAGSPDRVYKVRDFTQLDKNLKDAIVQQICDDQDRNTPFPFFTTPRPTRDDVAGVWIGMEAQGRGTYAWVDGSRRDYDNWRFGQPDLQPGEACVVSEHEPLQRWSDAECSRPRPFICKMDPIQRLRDALFKITNSNSRVQSHRYMKLRRRLLSRSGLGRRAAHDSDWVQANIFPGTRTL